MGRARRLRRSRPPHTPIIRVVGGRDGAESALARAAGWRVNYESPELDVGRGAVNYKYNYQSPSRYDSCVSTG